MTTKKLTEGALKRIIKEEIGRLVEAGMAGPGPAGFSYTRKAEGLRDALAILLELSDEERRTVGESDPDLEGIIEALEGYLEAVRVLSDQE